MEKKPGDVGGLAESSNKAVEETAVVEAPKVEAPKVEAPKVEAPKVEAPKVEAPKVEAPKVEAPKVEPPKSSPPDASTEVPDPDEDDLDDLDDMLDEFTPSKTAPSLPSKPESKDVTLPAERDGLSDEDFAKQLQAGMAELFGDLGTSPEMQAQFESMLKELGSEAAALGAPSASEPAAKEPSASSAKKEKTPKSTAEGAAAEENFQDTIRKTMERLNVSGSQATAAANTDASAEEDFMAEMLKAMQTGGEGSEEDFSKMLLGMMEQLTNKEILYEPMKELDEKFPDWLVKNEGKITADDLKRYKDQQGFVREIVARFERTAYSDDNAQDREYIVERMQKMQAAGSPPPDLVGDMAAAQEVFGGPPEDGCPQQ